jgi:hypothetical protein
MHEQAGNLGLIQPAIFQLLTLQEAGTQGDVISVTAGEQHSEPT